MKKILIVNNNMRVGGVQKSLCNLLWALDEKKCYEITLLLFCKTGAYINDIPPDIRVIESGGVFRYMGESQRYFKNSLKDTVIRGFFAVVSKIFGRSVAVKLMLPVQPLLKESYDCAISFLHNGKNNSFYGGVQDYVLNCVNAEKKIAFLHCDYSRCGSDNESNNSMMAGFDKIAACSDGCRRAFETVLPELSEKCVTVRNCHLFSEIKKMANEDPVTYDSSFTNVITVARLSPEKGIDRAVRAVAAAVKKGLKIRLHIVGGGAMGEKLRALAAEEGVAEYVIFHGEQSNPYRYMINADLLLLPSYHEAAPMVIDEARCLGLPVLTSKTTSSVEMVLEEECGWVCENSDIAIADALCNAVEDKKALTAVKDRLKTKQADNSKAIAQFDALIAD